MLLVMTLFKKLKNLSKILQFNTTIMPICTATTAAGNPCTKNASVNYNGLCGVHGAQAARVAAAVAQASEAAAAA